MDATDATMCVRARQGGTKTSPTFMRCQGNRMTQSIPEHVESLARYVGRLRDERPATLVPGFDPADGGTRARLLFLLEKPGAMIARAPEAALVSRDNATGTAQAIGRFMAEADIPRRETVLWNVVPWWNGTPLIRAAEHRDGLAALADLLPLLPRLEGAVLVGRRAGEAREMLEAHGLAVFASAHPSGQVRAARPELWAAIPARWREAADAVLGAERVGLKGHSGRTDRGR